MVSNKAPRVFISYAWEGDSQKEWARYLAERLNLSGVNTRLDQWHVKAGDSFTHFMEKEVEAADFVIAICTPLYALKSNERKGGVGYEQQIVSGKLAYGIDRKNFIPLLKTGDITGPNCAIPVHFTGIAAIDFRDESNFDESLEELLRVIFNKPKFGPPPIAPPPVFSTSYETPAPIPPKVSASVFPEIKRSKLRFSSQYSLKTGLIAGVSLLMFLTALIFVANNIPENTIFSSGSAADKDPEERSQDANEGIAVSVDSERIELPDKIQVTVYQNYDPDLKTTVEKNSSRLLTLINEAFKADKSPELPDSIVTDEGRRSINLLWKSGLIRCPARDLHSNLVLESGGDTYQLTNIPLYINNQNKPTLLEGRIQVSLTGLIDGITLPSNSFHQSILISNIEVTRDRKNILNFIEDFRTAYNRKDLEFFSAVLSESIVVDEVVIQEYSSQDPRERRIIRQNKPAYLSQLAQLFDENEFINIRYDEVTVNMHSIDDNVHGISLLQTRTTSNYTDEGYVLLICDFRDRSSPVIHNIRWQPEKFTSIEDILRLN